MTEVENGPKHIAALACPFGTHAPPLLNLVTRLSAAVPNAIFSFFSTKQSNGMLFRNHHDLGSTGKNKIKPYNVADGMPENYVFSGNPQAPVENFLNATPGNFRQAMDAAVEETGRPITCIITDAFFWFAADMAQELQVPWVPLWTAGPRSLLLHVETDLIRQKLGLSGPKDRSIDFLPGFSAIREVDMPGEITAPSLDFGFPMLLYKMGLMLSQATAVATNSFEELDILVVNELKSRFQKFLNVGPFVLASPDSTVSDPQGCLEWLDKQEDKSVVYISFGSVIMPPPHELAELAEALEASGFPFLWSFKEDPEAKLPKGFLERTKEKGKIVSWTPQVKVLQHNATGVFVTHCGWNSILESIIGKVPMICRPFFGDQQLNTRTIEAVWEAGVGIKGGIISKDSTVEALKLILSTEKGDKMREKLEALKELALDAVKSDGSSTENFKDLVNVVIK